jgi:hypothetical protein
MMYHEKLYEVAKRDDEFKLAIKGSGQKLPFWPDSIDKGMWAACYSGWVLGRYGNDEYMRRESQWKDL